MERSVLVGSYGVDILVELCIVFVVIIIFVQLLKLIVLIVDENRNSINFTILASKHQRSHTIVVSIIDHLALGDEKVKSFGIRIHDRIMDQIAALSVELQSGRIHTEIGLQNGHVWINTCNVSRHYQVLIIGLLQKSIAIQHFNSQSFFSLKHAGMMEAWQPQHLLALVLLKDVLDKREITFADCFRPLLGQATQVRDEIHHSLAAHGCIAFTSLVRSLCIVKHIFDKTKRRVQLEHVTEVDLHLLAELIVMSEGIIALLTATREI